MLKDTTLPVEVRDVLEKLNKKSNQGSSDFSSLIPELFN
jgi:hypothetical protein